MMITSNIIIDELNKLYPGAKCELIYHKDYELLIAAVLSAQTTDIQVNKVTKELFAKYDIFSLVNAKLSDVEQIVKSAGTYKRKAVYIIQISSNLVRDYNGTVPNNRQYLESLPGVGRKVCNVVLANLFDEPTFAVDTHVFRVAKRLGITKENDDVKITEKKLMQTFPKENWEDLHHQLVLFGRYICKAKKPDCGKCSLSNYCTNKKS